ncbi:putative transcription initiation protein spt4-like, putatve [Theileria annulata]|uniref:Possible transcription initiation protein spt4-like, putatve n=1 Tax=Theileria annulata TaxID=5874 RepID=Q4UH88_THEAN|nr:putative transcription initiation protein spt4-like, putatve [Theileria annulata]CAI73551.1 possible transcription initiation protein spt4-like, putatve [Theileria annulata]|eukprot:XP_954228.1 possible transcription initiation protein spt4-like, putatve [Theileria annulata]
MNNPVNIFDDEEELDIKNNKYDFIPHGVIRKHTEGDKPNPKLRACISCRLIMSENQVFHYGACNSSSDITSPRKGYFSIRGIVIPLRGFYSYIPIIVVHFIAVVSSLSNSTLYTHRISSLSRGYLFYENGCGNCSFLQMDGDHRRILDCTSSNFNGFISIIDPQKSWSARYNNLSIPVTVLVHTSPERGFLTPERASFSYTVIYNDLIPGCYAISVNGTLPESIKDELLQ